jgi:RNA polymerase sigma factor (sigma-70 family)
MLKKQEILAIHFTIERLLITHFSKRVMPQDRNEIRQAITEKIILQNLSHDETKGTLNKWLYRIIQNYLNDLHRKKKRSFIRTSDNFEQFKIEDDDTAILKEELLADRMIQLDDLLSKEKPENQTHIRSFYVEKKSEDEIAKLINKKAKNLAMDRLRIKARLKKGYRPNRLLE